jgi:hypothetical protein
MKKIIFSKKTILCIALLAILQNIFGQTCIPNFIHLNAVARNPNGTAVVPPQKIDVLVELFSGNPGAGGTLIYCEQQQNILTNNFGEFALDFGNAALICSPPAVLMGNVDWNKCNIYYRLSWRITGGNYTPIATGPFTSVPYAFAARTAERVRTIPYATASSSSWINSTQTRNWVSPPNMQVTVPESGIYMLSATASAYGTHSVTARVYKVASNVDIPQAGFLVGSGNGGSGTNGDASSGSVTTIVTLTKGEVLRLDFYNELATGAWFYGLGTQLNIVKLGD